MTIFEYYDKCKCKSQEKEVIEVEDDEEGTLQDLCNETQAVATAINAEVNSISKANNKPENEDDTNSSKSQKYVIDTKKTTKVHRINTLRKYLNLQTIEEIKKEMLTLILDDLSVLVLQL